MPASPPERYLIVNADDFGLTSGINRGIIEAHTRGIVTSASLMVRYPAAVEAADYARAHRGLSVGLHFDAAEWRCRRGEWSPVYQVTDTGDATQVRAEVQRQLLRFERLLGRAPTHLDSHQHVHMKEPVRSILSDAAKSLGMPLRSFCPRVRYCGGFYGQTADGLSFPEGISLFRLQGIIEKIQTGWTELGCHPGYADELDSSYLHEREEELRVLCSDHACRAIARYEIQLRNFSKIPSERR